MQPTTTTFGNITRLNLHACVKKGVRYKCMTYRRNMPREGVLPALSWRTTLPVIGVFGSP